MPPRSTPQLPLLLITIVILSPAPPPCTVAVMEAPIHHGIPAPKIAALGKYKWLHVDKVLYSRRSNHVTPIPRLKSYLCFYHFGYVQWQSRCVQASVDHPSDHPTTVSTRTTQHFVFFQGKPQWLRRIPITLTYALSPDHLISYLTLSDIKNTFIRAFSRWSSVIPVTFVEADDYGFADIKIGFYSGDHGDGEPFDGVLGILAHSFSPESGRLHLDAAETWAVDFEVEKSAVAIDLESVAVHEIGHLLGLGHSEVKEAVMFPSLKPREKKVDLAIDDVEGVQALYGSNPNFTLGSLLASDTTSENRAADSNSIPPFVSLVNLFALFSFLL